MNGGCVSPLCVSSTLKKKRGEKTTYDTAFCLDLAGWHRQALDSMGAFRPRGTNTSPRSP